MGEFNNLVDEDVVWERTQGFGVYFFTTNGSN